MRIWLSWARCGFAGAVCGTTGFERRCETRGVRWGVGASGASVMGRLQRGVVKDVQIALGVQRVSPATSFLVVRFERFGWNAAECVGTDWSSLLSSDYSFSNLL